MADFDVKGMTVCWVSHLQLTVHAVACSMSLSEEAACPLPVTTKERVNQERSSLVLPLQGTWHEQESFAGCCWALQLQTSYYLCSLFADDYPPVVAIRMRIACWQFNRVIRIASCSLKGHNDDGIAAVAGIPHRDFRASAAVGHLWPRIQAKSE